MAQQAKIVKSSFKKEYASPNGVIYYHDVTTEGETKPWNIGSKEKNPDFLAVGAQLNFEVEDAAKRKIKRAKLDGIVTVSENNTAQITTGTQTPQPPQKDTYTKKQDAMAVGMGVGNAVSAVALMVAHGKVDIKQFKEVTRRIYQVATELKEEFCGGR